MTRLSKKNFGARVLMKILKTCGVEYIETERNYVLMVPKRLAQKRLDLLAKSWGIKFKF